MNKEISDKPTTDATAILSTTASNSFPGNSAITPSNTAA
jgi:hypothetical protein